MPTPWQTRPYGLVDAPVLEALEGLLDRADLAPEARCRLLDVLVSELTGGDDPRVVAAAEEALAIARSLDDPDLLASGLAAVIKATHADGYADRREALATELAGIARERDLPSFQWSAAQTFATVAAARGDAGALRAHLDEASAVARRYRLVEAQAVLLCSEGMLAHIAGRYDESERHYTRATAMLERQGSLHAVGFLGMAVFTLRMSQGRLAEIEPMLGELARSYAIGADAWAVALVEQGRHDEARAARVAPAQLPSDYFTTFFATVRAKAVVALGAADEAPALVALLAPLHDQLGGALSTSLAVQPVAHTLGELHRLLGDHAAAAGFFAEAERVAQRWGAAHWADAARAALAAV